MQSLYPRRLSAALLRFAFVALALLSSELNGAEQLYSCGMHPQIIKKEPGNCPICGMKLTPIRANVVKAQPSAATPPGERRIKYFKSTMMPGEVKPTAGKDSMGMEMVPVYDDEATASAENRIQIDSATTQRMNLKTALVEHGPVRRDFRTVGMVAYNESGLRDITTKYEGWIEKLNVNTTWTVVKAGDPLFEIYSPELYNAELNYAGALRAEASASGPLTAAALARLQLFDVPSDFIEQLKKTGEAQRIFVFRAPNDGVVIEKMAVVGQMMKPGERIFRLADFSSVWVQAQIYEKDLPFVHKGQSAVVRTSYGPERAFEGRVDLMLPQVQEQTRTVTARIVLPNPDAFLRPGMFVDVSFSAQLAEDAVLVPDMAVLRSGESNTVFVALDGGFFEPRAVKLGARSNGNFYEVLSGLRAGERIVTSGQFMLDSESQLRDAIQKMLKNSAASQATPTAELKKESPPDNIVSPMAETAATPPAGASLPKEAAALFTPIALAAADAADALAADDFDGYKKQLLNLRSNLAAFFAGGPQAEHGPLASYQDGLPEPTDLAAARRQFEPFSSAVADLAREHHLQHTEKLHIFECPMAPVTGKARWIQRNGGTKNPFFGSEMPNCGSEIAGPAELPKP